MRKLCLYAINPILFRAAGITSLGAFVRLSFGYAVPGYARDLGINHIIPVNAILWSRSPINTLKLHQSCPSNFTQVERS